MADFQTCISKSVDDVRAIHEDFGTRPYRMYIVVRGWTDGHVNEGTEVEKSRKELTPAPRLLRFDELTGRYESAGEVNSGKLRVTEISSRYVLRELQPELAAGDTVHLEVVFGVSGRVLEAAIDYVSFNVKSAPGWTLDCTVREYR